ncbi:hypothetical protein DM02DRAFT_717827 [Periconia macrospinosa]|uniref:Serine hydrolase domain-containing protein n=1 Tax=Periconia macrospinosa TaxID=97972 RepID=A0A2V1DW77_9PLEO|nr:hypothetical protein DM02DRAFT_717827 [Periconia macrospinosa]
MKILCLHGNGTNGHIMRLQTAALRQELADDHEYEFVEAAVQAPMSEGVEGLTLPGSSFYAFYNPEDLSSSMRQSLNQLNDFISAEGPFDAVLDFSGGAFLAAMYLIEQQSLRDSGESNDSLIKCGIFLASASCKAEMKVLGASTVPRVGKTSIQVPTAHIWGSNDTIAPTGGHDLSRVCNAAKRQILVHEGGHELPRGDSLTKAVHVIRRTIDLAEDF